MWAPTDLDDDRVVDLDGPGGQAADHPVHGRFTSDRRLQVAGVDRADTDSGFFRYPHGSSSGRV
jgi:hypothetical protein